ncbi:hypothetical protein COV58_01750 [Candidatus Roizmanbacteria bacterium CG11_big_fil_rev_8_21_14_0_20_36_8]|uniref:Helix-turn-helix domain-containing protein n=1 Tax=Candidatus Roizmanbacteria bacterium CG11_big_fil_rev_8_21_14_0_20_36_8 TaxID=1974856 RepID=A0A2M6IUI6_9BACT|nr:MAG: hypothetical protein COV58_01750 [Candidatus Roizmanbacteria bacterium CG11_big_fil_rev_8_21_14_0_20_36_8]
MSNTNQLPKTYTPEDVSKIYQLSKNTIYDLISKGEIIAKKIGNVYRIPESSLSFVQNGLDNDIRLMEDDDRKNLPFIQKTLKKVRAEIAGK